MTDRHEMLRLHINAANEREPVWGFDDCTPWAAMWLELVTGRKVDRPAWSSWDEAKALIDEAGSLVALWERVLSDFGLVETFDPQFGDIGVIETNVAGQVGGIFLHAGRFAWRAKGGVMFLVPRRIVKAWSVPT